MTLKRASGQPVGCVVPGTNRRLYYATKRAIDIVMALVLIVVLLLLLPFVALAIKLDSSGPVFFRQTRLRGRRKVENGKYVWVIEPFTFWKLRTMVATADSAQHRDYMAAYIRGDDSFFASSSGWRGPGDSYRMTDDPRVTRVGALLRALSLDEAPQLWNVLKGEMSFVGPRPPIAYEVELYDDRAYRRFAAPGGITGWAQVKGRCTVGFEEQVQLDLEYIDRQSIWFDLKVLLRTPFVVLSRKGAG
jgi:lipopolysaccharide/colanic/teichoic acid biosynthesis glycosyltransferase